jgi:ATP-dependent Lhr-like helicase
MIAAAPVARPIVSPSQTRPQRAAGALVVLTDGQLAGWLGRGEQNLLTFLPPDEPARSRASRALAQALSGLVDQGRRKALLIARLDGEEVASSPLAPELRSANFIPGIKGYLKRSPLPPPGMHSRAPRGAPQGPLGPDIEEEVEEITDPDG